MAVCLPLVAAAIGTQAMLEMADGGFSEDLLDSINGDMLDVWPSINIDDHWLDDRLPDGESDLLGEDFIGEFLVVGDAAVENAKRSTKKRDKQGDINAATEDAEPSTEKRNIITAIVNAFARGVRALITMAGRAGGRDGAARASQFFSEGKKPNLKKPCEAKLSRGEQKGKAKEVSENKKWKKCLRGEKAEK